MNSDLKIALLCNNKMALPAMQLLIREGVLCAVATADKDREVMNVFSRAASDNGIPFQFFSKESYREAMAEWIEQYQPDIVLVMTFPWRIPAAVLQHPVKGFVNFHFGLLPEMRGADPIFEAIRQQLPQAGLTVHQMDEQLDTGPIIFTEALQLTPEFTYGMLCSRMAGIGEKLCGQLTGMLRSGQELPAARQDESKARYWPKCGPESISAKWASADSRTIRALVRACNPVIKGLPTVINGWRLGICEVAEVALQGDASAIVPGTILAIDGQNGLLVCCKDGIALRLEVVYTEEGMLPGYKLAYFGLAPGMVFGEL